jgi:adenosylcobinamide kinase/adenosylcobinamide-phosphate guanylyltransferase
MMSPSPVLDCRIVLVLGGARSGKSRYAQALAEASGREPLFVATAEALDDEMADRIRRHREDRGGAWRTREEPLELTRVLGEEAAPRRVALVDCLTLWLSNLMCAGRSPQREIELLVKTLGRLAGPAILVSNEVGLGIAPMTPLGREFRDWQGRLNSEVAAVADVVVAMTAGIPRLAKPAPSPNLRFV